MAIARYPSIVIDCPDPHVLASFYGTMLGWEVETKEDWADIRADDGQCISFQQVADYTLPTWPVGEVPQHMHLDVMVDDLDAAGAAVVDLGASEHMHQPGSTFGCSSIRQDIPSVCASNEPARPESPHADPHERRPAGRHAHPGRGTVTASDGIDAYFVGKPDSMAIFHAIVGSAEEHGDFDIEVKSQISFERQRKFAWFWLYNVTKKNPDGVPHLMLAIDRPVDTEHVRNVEQISSKRWNHQIVVSSLEDARSVWLAELIHLAFDYGSG